MLIKKNNSFSSSLSVLFIVFLFVTLTISINVPIQPELNVPVPKPFSLDTAFSHLLYSYATYCSPLKVVNWTCEYCSFKEINPQLKVTAILENVSTNTFGFIGYSQLNQTIVMAFRGTQMASLQNWITNLNFPKTEPYPKFPSALVHSGFLSAYQGVKSQVESGLNYTQELCPSCDRLIITGHSLGGALAILAATDVYESGLTTLPLEMYTFGSPRLGNVAFAEYFETTISKNLYRLVNDHDLVPHLPPMDLNFHHLPIEVWFNTTSVPLDYYVCNSSGEDPNCSDSLTVALNIPQHLDYLGIEKALC
ncbi:hypothetical protein CYY_007961 [Polysphondylium violaceum]|uniref:Fungal lipase-type domain-containing protein n=1 Tax=Polysphondylium violaceum TaxID=133409 RepID=A0A8J4PNW6_9MYCE|nr:hypothetical protein CYY_007961 [Polysphondylium violaceum]